MKQALCCATLFLGLMAWGCKSGDSETSTATKSESSKEAPGLIMSSDSAVCKKAMKCCEAMVKSEKGEAKLEDINLSCSGVAMATTDADCTAFAKGYAATFEAKEKPVPAECQ